MGPSVNGTNRQGCRDASLSQRPIRLHRKAPPIGGVFLCLAIAVDGRHKKKPPRPWEESRGLHSLHEERRQLRATDRRTLRLVDLAVN